MVTALRTVMLMVFVQRMEMILQGQIDPYTVLWGLSLYKWGIV